MKITEHEEPSLFILGLELLDELGQVLYDILNATLGKLYGSDWFANTLITSATYKSSSPRDLSNILIQTVNLNNQNYRVAFQQNFNHGKAMTKDQLDLMDDLRITRNEYVHRMIYPVSSDEILGLANGIYRLLGEQYELGIKAGKIVKVVSQGSFEAKDLIAFSSILSPYVNKINESARLAAEADALDEIAIEAMIDYQSELQDIWIAEMELENSTKIKSEVSEPTVLMGAPKIHQGTLLPQKFSLHLDGNIVNRKTEKTLFNLYGEPALDFGRELLKLHPKGGRLRIASNGIIVGYNNETWIEIGVIPSDMWFSESES